MLSQAETVAQQPFTAYTGTLTAPMSGNQQQGSTLASQTAATGGGAAGADAAAGNTLLGQVGANSDWNSSTAAKYMNPYTQDVTNATLAQQQKSYNQSLSQLQTGAAGSGSFGNSREAIQEADLASSNNMNAATLTANNNAAAYNNAMQAWQGDNNTKLAAANAYENAGQDITKMTSQQISDLMSTGGVSQAISQTDLNNQYAQFMRQQGWSAQQLNSLISAVGTAKGSTTQQPAVQSNTANQLLGLGSTVAGLFGGGSTSSTPTIGNSSPTAAFADSINPGLGSQISFDSSPAIATAT